MSSPTSLPSVFLPPLHPAPPSSTLLPLLALLVDIYTPSNVVIDLTSPTPDVETVRGPEHDDFEAAHVRGWLGRVVSLGSRELARGGGEEWERIVDIAAGVLADISGHCAAGASTRTFLLPSLSSRPPKTSHSQSLDSPLPLDSSPPARASPFLPLIIRDTTLLASSTGFRTWGSAPLLSRLIAAQPYDFVTPSPTPLHILELGSGTGLVGLTTAAALSSIGQAASIDLTDFEEHVLDNLAHNAGLNAGTLGSTNVAVERLDWTDFHEGRLTRTSAREYDYVFGADLIYEPQHLNWLHATVSALLRFPSADSSTVPTFHLVLPLRSTHALEHDGFDAAFSAEGDGREERETVDAEGGRWRLTTLERSDATGEDGFGGARERAAEGKVSRYWVYRIGWSRVE
ncbi:putative methyltransferase-domain-containing protein [Leucosporidium creatinivorum]|uniref:Putative methyltransferase-domain-containing protein n=1 Tax=Leucosporidium creatinivorum TaxID=106004 RepID=A0A1Y2FW50_9BASI|nr:putative methyltransferase-domain-containing protein [Leucosporidium creatinivorum]